MKVIAKCKPNTNCACFKDGETYQAFELFQCQPDSNLLSSYGLVVIDGDGDAIPVYEADRLWGVSFEVVS